MRMVNNPTHGTALGILKTLEHILGKGYFHVSESADFRGFHFINIDPSDDPLAAIENADDAKQFALFLNFHSMNPVDDYDALKIMILETGWNPVDPRSITSY